MSDKPLSILQISASDRMGGAEQIAWTLFTGYRDRGHQSSLVVGKKTSADRDVHQINHDARRSAWARFCLATSRLIDPLARKIKGGRRLSLLLRDNLGQPTRTRSKFAGEEDFDFPASADVLKLPAHPPDLLHCHNLHSMDGYFDLRALAQLSHDLPVFTTLHDAWLLSGHCAHSFDCDRWQTGCGSCPDLSIYPAIAKDATAFNFSRKRDIFARSKLRICTPSQWLMDKVNRSMLRPAMIEGRIIPNGVDLNTFKPMDQQLARQKLRIAPHTKVVLFAAAGIRNNCFKDFTTLRAALAQVAAENAAVPNPLQLEFIALGEDSPPEQIGNARIRFVPFEKDRAIVASYFAAADVYVHAARADTFPNTIIEAMACGKPVIASRVGGIPEQVRENITGFLTDQGDAGVMASALLGLLRDEQKCKRMGDHAAAIARDQYDANAQIDQTLSWYLDVLKNPS